MEVSPQQAVRHHGKSRGCSRSVEDLARRDAAHSHVVGDAEAPMWCAQVRPLEGVVPFHGLLLSCTGQVPEDPLALLRVLGLFDLPCAPLLQMQPGSLLPSLRNALGLCLLDLLAAVAKMLQHLRLIS